VSLVNESIFVVIVVVVKVSNSGSTNMLIILFDRQMKSCRRPFI